MKLLDAHIFKHEPFNRILKESREAVLTKDAYHRLSAFEFYLCEHMRDNKLGTLELIEAHKLLALIAMAQTQLLELKLNVDLNNDGKVGYE